MQKAGRDSDRVREHNEIVAQNKATTPKITAEYLHELKQGHFILDKAINATKQKTAEARRESQSLRFKGERIIERAKNVDVLKKRVVMQKPNGKKLDFYKTKVLLTANYNKSKMHTAKLYLRSRMNIMSTPRKLQQKQNGLTTKQKI